MSERVFEGLVKVTKMPQRGMITLRGDLAAASIQDASTAIGDVSFPGQGGCTCVGERGVAWMSPDELLVMCPHAELAQNLTTMRATLEGTHHLLQDVSDARVIFRLEGEAGREVLAKLCPVDLSPAAFQPGHFRRTRMAQIACAFWMPHAASFELIVFSSVADYAWGVLTHAANPAAPVGHFAI